MGRFRSSGIAQYKRKDNVTFEWLLYGVWSSTVRYVRQQPPMGKTWNVEGGRGRQAGSGSPRCCLGCRTILLRRPTGVTLRHLGSQWDRVSSRQECVHSFPPQLFLSSSAKSSPHRFRHARRIHLLATKSIADYLISTYPPLLT